jgi:hypothetical protein
VMCPAKAKDSRAYFYHRYMARILPTNIKVIGKDKPNKIPWMSLINFFLIL